MAAIPPDPEPPTSALLPANVTLLQPATRYFRLMDALIGANNMPRGRMAPAARLVGKSYTEENAAALMPWVHLRRIR